MNKTIVIIGAGKGISFYVAQAFQKMNFNLALISRNADNLKTLKQELTGKNTTISTYPVDVQDTEALTAVLSQLKKDYNTIDVLFYNAAHISMRNILEESEASLVTDFKINVVGLLTSTLALKDNLIKSNGAILATGGGYRGKSPIPGLGSLSLGKAALRSLLESLQQSLPENVYVGSVSANGIVNEEAILHHPQVIADTFVKLYKDQSVLEVAI